MKKIFLIISFNLICATSPDVFAQPNGSWVQTANGWVLNNAPRLARNSIQNASIDQVIYLPVKRYYEGRGYYVPPKPPGIPWQLRPAYVFLTRARPAY